MRHASGRRLTLVVVAAIGLLTGCGDETTVAPEPRTTIDGSEVLMVVGDWGSGTPEQEAVAAAMADHAASTDVGAIVTTGDNFYSDDAEELMEPFGWAVDRDIPFLVAWGNHDVATPGRIEAIDEQFDDPPRWVTHRWGPIEIVILDSTQIGAPEQVDFMTRSMAASEDPTIVVFHHPPYSCGAHGNTQEIHDNWLSGFDDDVFLVLSGHEHNYQRFEADGVTYVVTGGGGRFLTGLAECSSDHPERIVGEEVHHFVVMRLSSERVLMTAIDVDGTVIDDFSVPLPSTDADE